MGAIVTDEGSMSEIRSRIAQTIAALTKLKIIWDDKIIDLTSKIRLLRSLVMSIFLYSRGNWTLTAEIERKIQTVEMRSFRRLLSISYKDHITNEEVRSRIWKPIGPYKELLFTVKRRKMKRYGGVTGASGLAKAVFEGTVPGGRRRGTHPGLDGFRTERRRQKGRETRGMAMVARSCGTPTVPMTMG